MANSVDLNETAHDEPSHLDLLCLQRYLDWSAGLKKSIDKMSLFPVLDCENAMKFRLMGFTAAYFCYFYIL